MSRSASLKKKYQILHRFMTGLTVSCLMIVVIGQTLAGSSSFEIIWRAGFVTFVLLLAEQFMLRLWSSWEDVRKGAEE